ncbi:MAG: ribonuclease Z [Clostridium sp.]
MVDICLLGCGGGMPMPFRNLSSTLINYKGRKILVDCGEGTQVSMRMIGWGFKSLDLIIITHTHGDHIVGLPGLLATIGNSVRTTPLTIIGPEGITEVVNGLRVIAKYLPYEVKIIENPKCVNLKVSREGLEVIDSNGEIKIETIEVDHSSPCLGYSIYIKREAKFDLEKALSLNIPKNFWGRLQKGEEIIYEDKLYKREMILGEAREGIKLSIITDSRPTKEMPRFIEKSNLFICEGTYGSDDDIEKAIKNKHMTFKEAANLALEGQVKELLLTHFSPAMMDPNVFLENATSVFKNTIIGEDRITKILKFE